jgi:hypothetical protein
VKVSSDELNAICRSLPGASSNELDIPARLSADNARSQLGEPGLKLKIFSAQTKMKLLYSSLL